MQEKRAIIGFCGMGSVILVLVFQFLFKNVGIECWVVPEIAVNFGNAVIATVLMVLVGMAVFVTREMKKRNMR